jgi:TonB family protein
MRKFRFVIAALSIFVAVSPVFGQTSPDPSGMAAEIVRLYKAEQFGAALPLAKRLVALRESEKTAKQTDLADAYRLLGLIMLGSGESSGAKENLRRSTEIYEAVDPATNESNLALAGLYGELAVIVFMEKDSNGALELLSKAAEKKTAVFGAESVEVADTLWDAGNIEYFRKNYKKAYERYRRVYEIRASKFGTMLAFESEMRYECTAKKTGNEFVRYVDPTGKSGSDESFGGTRIVKGGVVNGKAINLVKPEYPMEARRNRATGSVQVSVTIDESGSVIFACAIAGPSVFYEATEMAAYASKFSPTRLNGNPVKVSGAIVYKFRP